MLTHCHSRQIHYFLNDQSEREGELCCLLWVTLGA